MALSGRFVVLLALGVVPLVVTSDPLTLLAWIGIVVILTIVDLVIAGSPRAITLTREVPLRVRLGEATSAKLRLSNDGNRRLIAQVRDAWEPSAGSSPSRQRVVIPAHERRTLTTHLVPFRRGERRTAHVTIRSFGPLRLAARQATIVTPGAIRVLPPFASRKHLPSRLARLRELDGRTSILLRGQGTEFDSLREYVRGDDVRSIDWRATARRTDPLSGSGPSLVVRTWRPERDRRVVVIIDSGRTAAARIDREARIDTAFEATLLLAALASRAGDRVDAVIYDRRVRGRVQGASGADLMSKLVDAMAPVEPELIEMDWSTIPALVRSVTPHPALVVLATSIDSPAASRSLLAMLPQLTRTHRVIVTSVVDPAVTEAAGQRGSRTEVYRAAAAERATLDIGRVSAAIRQLGADVVTGSPPDLPPALADRYVALKAAGLL